MNSLSPPGSPVQPHDSRPRTVSALSYNSNRSRRSNSSSHKLDLTESHKDKKRLNTKADPSRALNEAQPAAVALEESNLEDIRLTRHKDVDGNVIADPDRSNPTRYRFERPLDTIRSFQAAAEGTSHRRASYYSRPSSQVFDNSPNRRSSYIGSSVVSPQQQRSRNSTGGYYRNASYGFPTQSTVEESPGSSQQYARPVRQPSNPYYGQIADSPTSHHSQHPSYETSGSEENNKSTNPSSQNSSFDHLQQFRKPEEYTYEQGYGNDMSYNNGPPQRAYQTANQQNIQQHGQQQFRGPPAVPFKDMQPNNPRVPIALNSYDSSPPAITTDLKATPSKRQSWLRRKFSRRES